MLQELQTIATAHAACMAQVLGISPGVRATTTLRQLLALAGFRLVAQRCRSGRGRLAAAGYRYRIEREALPAGVDPLALVAAWEADLHAQAAGGVYQKSPYK